MCESKWRKRWRKGAVGGDGERATKREGYRERWGGKALERGKE